MKKLISTHFHSIFINVLNNEASAPFVFISSSQLTLYFSCVSSIRKFDGIIPKSLGCKLPFLPNEIGFEALWKKQI